MTRTVFDQASRRMALAEPEEFFPWLLSNYQAALRFRRWLQTRTTPPPGDAEKVGDTVAEMEAISDPAPPWLFVIEFQTEPDPDMFGRLSVQGGQLWLDQRPDDLPGSRYQLAGGVVNLTGTRASAPASRSYRCKADEALSWTLGVKEVWVAEQSADATLSRVEKGEWGRVILPLVSLMHGAGEPGIIQRWLAEAAKEPDSRRRGELGYLTEVFAELKEWYPSWAQALKGWNVRESITVNKYKQLAKEEAEREVKQELEDAKREVKRQAAVEALRETLSGLLQTKFSSLPNSVKQRIEAVDNPDALRLGIVQVLTLTKPEDLTL